MPLTPMGFLMSRGFPSSESVLLSEPLPSCPWTDCCSTPLSAARVDELIASGWLFNLPSTKSARDCRGFPSPESVHLLAVLPVVQGRASRVLSDSNNHLLTVPRAHLGLDIPANRNTAPKSSCGAMPDTTAAQLTSEEAHRTSSYQTKANRSSAFLQFDDPWRTRFHRPEIPHWRYQS